MNFELILPRVFAAQPPAISASTRYCAVYGYPIAHSASPAMQNSGMAVLGLDWRYLAFDVRPENLRAAIAGAKAMKFVGLNLTVPHKMLALQIVDELDESAKRWGAVNTIRFEARRSGLDWSPIHQLPAEEIRDIRAHGFNTDADALARALHEDLSCDLAGGTVLLLGLGGAGRMAARRLAVEGVKRLYLVNRTSSKAVELAKEMGGTFPECEVTVGYPSGIVDLLLNATSVGLKADDPLPFDANQFALGNAQAVYDMIYRPAETPLLRAAKASGCRTANGIGMLLYQGAKALEIWSGQPAPILPMRDALLKNVYGAQADLETSPRP